MEGKVGRVSWPIAYSLPTKWWQAMTTTDRAQGGEVRRHPNHWAMLPTATILCSSDMIISNNACFSLSVSDSVCVCVCRRTVAEGRRQRQGQQRHRCDTCPQAPGQVAWSGARGTPGKPACSCHVWRILAVGDSSVRNPSLSSPSFPQVVEQTAFLHIMYSYSSVILIYNTRRSKNKTPSTYT